MQTVTISDTDTQEDITPDTKDTRQVTWVRKNKKADSFFFEQKDIAMPISLEYDDGFSFMSLT